MMLGAQICDEVWTTLVTPAQQRVPSVRATCRVHHEPCTYKAAAPAHPSGQGQLSSFQPEVGTEVLRLTQWDACLQL